MKLAALVLALAWSLTTQLSPRMEALVVVMKPLLPFPAASADGELPADNSARSRWFVIWPASDETRIVVKANPLNPEVQKAGAEAMEQINAAVAAAERRAQASYDKAIEQLRKTGKSDGLEPVTLDDEGVAGERIDAELEITIELAAAESFDLTAGEMPIITPGPNGAAWQLTVPAHIYSAGNGNDRREHFRAAETRVYFGVTGQLEVARVASEPRFRVVVPAAAKGWVVIVRGNEAMVSQLTSEADWSKLSKLSAR